MAKKIMLVILDPFIYTVLMQIIGFGMGGVVGVSLAIGGMMEPMYDTGMMMRLEYSIVFITALVMLFVLALRDLRKPTVKKRWVFREVGIKNSMLLLMIGFYANILCACVFFYLKTLFHVEAEVQENTTGMMFKNNVVVFALITAIVVPIVEEWMFRMSVIERFQKGSKGKWSIILIQAFIFGLFHMNFAQSIYTFLLGILLGAAYFRFRSVIAPLMIHMGFNGMGIVIAALPQIQNPLSDPSTLNMTIGIALGVIILCIWMMQLFKGDLETEDGIETVRSQGNVDDEMDIDQMEAAYWQVGKME